MKHLTIFYSKPKFGKIGPKTKILLDVPKFVHEVILEGASNETDINILIVYILNTDLGKLVSKLKLH